MRQSENWPSRRPRAAARRPPRADRTSPSPGSRSADRRPGRARCRRRGCDRGWTVADQLREQRENLSAVAAGRAGLEQYVRAYLSAQRRDNPPTAAPPPPCSTRSGAAATQPGGPIPTACWTSSTTSPPACIRTTPVSTRQDAQHPRPDGRETGSSPMRSSTRASATPSPCWTLPSGTKTPHHQTVTRRRGKRGPATGPSCNPVRLARRTRTIGRS